MIVTMNGSPIVFEATTLEEARQKLFKESPRGRFLQSEIDIAPKTITVTAIGDSTEDAFVAALRQQPEGTSISNRKEIASARRTTVRVNAWDKEQARATMLAQAGRNAVLESSREIQPPKKGFLGFGKVLGEYEGVVFCRASVEVQFSQPARIEATFGARISSWAGLIHHLFSPGDKIIDELGERFGYQVLFIFHEREFVPTYYEGIPFSRVSSKTVEKSELLVNSTKLPGMLGLAAAVVGASLLPDRYDVRSDGQIARKTNTMADAAIVSVASCLPKGNISMLGDEVGRRAFEAIMHYAKIPIVRFFLGLSFSHEILSEGPLSYERSYGAKFDWQKYLAQIYSGCEALLLEIYDRLPDGGVITDDIIVKTVRAFFELA